MNELKEIENEKVFFFLKSEEIKILKRVREKVTNTKMDKEDLTYRY